MEVFYGFKDGSGDWFLTVDTDKCDGCGKCVPVCPASILEIGANEYDPLEEKPMALVKEAERNKIKFRCAGCKPGYGPKPAPCVDACPGKAITHSEGWKLSASNQN
jgi:Fe-S-cluster-containing hydrogenase component 2